MAHSVSTLERGEWVDIRSKNVAAIRYEGQTKMLYVKFVSGRTGYYKDVPYTTAASMLHAPSKGKFVHQVLKGRFVYDEL